MSLPTKLSVVGLGKLGSPLAACLASKGFTVKGLDINQGFVDSFNKGVAPVQEPLLSDMFTANASRLSATTSHEELILNSDVTFTIVPTPSIADGSFSNEYLVKAFEKLGEALKKKDTWHLFVITSTVLPGSTDKVLIPALEKASGKKLGKDFGLCYSPLFIALGNVVKNILNPDMTLVGESDEKSGSTLEQIYAKTVDNGSKSCRMNFVNAEIAKISVNTYVTMKISFANQLAEICEGLPFADVDVVTNAVGADTRIGKKYLKGAMGYGGPCFPRDNRALASVANQLGASAILAEATDKVNDRQVDRVVNLVKKANPNSQNTVTVIGTAYKPDTPVTEESQGVMIADRLVKAGYKVTVWDPLALEMTQSMLGSAVAYATSKQEAVKNADVVVISLPGNDYAPNPLDLKKGSLPTVVDCWGILPKNQFQEVSKYFKLGVGPA